VSTCLECGFENPRRWIGCARCGRLLGPRFFASDALSGTLETRTTRRGPWPSFPEGESPAEDAPSETDSLALMRAPTLTDARPLFGQNTVLDAVRVQIAEAFVQWRATATLISGTAGSGRTRVLERASEFAAQHYPNVRVFYAACRNHEEGPYAPFSWLLLERFGITPASSPTTVREEMLLTVKRALPGAEPEVIAEAAHLLGHVAGVPFPGSEALERLASSPHELRERAAIALGQLLESDCGSGTLLVLLDDMHHAESDAWQVLETLIRTHAKIAFVISGDASLEARLPALLEHARSSFVELQPLGDSDVAELVKSLLPSLHETPEPFVSALRHRSRGNPSALTELVRALEERGLFKSTPAGLEVDLEKLARGELPLTMGDAIRARLAGLTPVELAVIQHASVVGELFWDGAVLALARSERAGSDTAEPLSVWTHGTDEAQLAVALRVLEAKRFVVRLGMSAVPGLSEYTFQFAGARAVVYSELPQDTRERWHATVAHWMTLATGLPAEGLSAALARHFERAGSPVRAAESYLRAADEERARLRTSMALRHVERALPLVAAHEVQLRIRVLHEHGSLLTTLGRFDEAHAAFAEIVRLAFRVSARGTGAAALSRIARIHRQRGEHTAALAHYEQALALFRAADDGRGVASTHDDLAQVHRLLGQLERALTSAQEALAIRSRGTDARGQAVSRNTLGYIEIDRGNFADAKAQLEAALAIRLSIGDHEGAVQTRMGLGKLAFFQGRMRDALRIYTQALDSARELGSQRLQSHLLNHLAEAHLAGGSPETAQELLIEAQRVAMHLRDQRGLSEIQRNLGLVALARSDPAADQQLSAALELARECGTRQSVALAHRSLGRLKAKESAQDDLPEVADAPAPAETSFRESIRIFEECGSLHELARTQAELGFHLAERGAIEGAKEALTQASITMKRLSLPELSRVAERLASL
jgi:tetratricopeptide (TPR) repeat protein